MRRQKTKIAAPYKSQFEKDFHDKFPQLEYEVEKVKYTIEHVYNPDFKISDNKFIETKGRWVSSDRAKHLYIREQHPEVTVYLVFMNPNIKLNRVSKTSYGEWATKHGIEWATIDSVPEEWFS